MEYKIVDAWGETLGTTIANLEEAVKKHCDEGWKLQGGVSATIEKSGNYNRCYMFQAMIKEN